MPKSEYESPALKELTFSTHLVQLPHFIDENMELHEFVSLPIVNGLVRSVPGLELGSLALCPPYSAAQP